MMKAGRIRIIITGGFDIQYALHFLVKLTPMRFAGPENSTALPNSHLIFNLVSHCFYIFVNGGCEVFILIYWRSGELTGN